VDEERRREADAEARRFFDELWSAGDVWEIESSPYERERLAALFATLAGRRYPRVLEIGAGGGEMTRMLAELADQVVGVDVSELAVRRARGRVPDPRVEFRVANVMEEDVETWGPWDLVVLSETIYYLGWLYPFFDVAWLAHALHQSLQEGGHLLLANTRLDDRGGLMSPWLIGAYRDLFGNVGFRIAGERVYRGVKDGAELDVLITLFVR
jgi:SAM-dependent methyltransferase